jgi:hypothetical protein
MGSVKEVQLCSRLDLRYSLLESVFFLAKKRGQNGSRLGLQTGAFARLAPPASRLVLPTAR